MTKLVYTFGRGKSDGTAGQRELLGGKGASCVEMARLGLPVPPGLIITTHVCRDYLGQSEKFFPDDLKSQVHKGLSRIESIAKRRFGDAKNPLLVSVRSGAAASMPGMMETILNLGLNDQTVRGLIDRTGNTRFGFDCYRRFIQMYADVVLGIPLASFELIIARHASLLGVTDTTLPATALEQVIADFLAVVESHSDAPFPQDPETQLLRAIGAVFDSWNGKRAIEYRRIAGISDAGGTACTVQAMVFGNMGAQSATGVAFTRNPSTGANHLYGEYLPNAQGEDVVAGIRTPIAISRESAPAGQLLAGAPLEEFLPDCFAELQRIRGVLESHYRDAQDIEFTIEEGQLWMLQTRTAKRTAAAAVKIAVDLVQEKVISKSEALLRIEPTQIEQLLHPALDPQAQKTHRVLASGLPASPGGAVGRIVFTADDAVDWHRRGESVILVREETSPEDIHGMSVAKGLLTARGGMTSHAAVVARGMGTPCVAGCAAVQIFSELSDVTIGTTMLHEGDWISIDGASGAVFEGQVPTTDAPLSTEFQRIMEWADAVRRLRIRANAETERDARVALAFGAEGIGLARTEHMFFEPGRIDLVREMILAPDVAARKRALAKLLPLQKNDFRELLQIMDGKPVTIRLLDPPLHEFLPHTDADTETVAHASGRTNLDIRQTVARMAEHNPMLGHRGCRLGVTYPEIYAMQVQAMVEAACELKKFNEMECDLEIELPLIGHVNELKHLRTIVTRVAEEVMLRAGVRIHYQVGAMLELPRACLTADAIAKHADFLSFGTNDLTQTLLGISRDDSGRFLQTYVDQHLLPNDPFVTIDREGVGAIMQLAVDRGRTTKHQLAFGICGEHGGDPASIAMCHTMGLDYVSCSPYRVPVARLAAAHAVLREKQKTTKAKKDS